VELIGTVTAVDATVEPLWSDERARAWWDADQRGEYMPM